MKFCLAKPQLPAENKYWSKHVQVALVYLRLTRKQSGLWTGQLYGLSWILIGPNDFVKGSVVV